MKTIPLLNEQREIHNLFQLQYRYLLIQFIINRSFVDQSTDPELSTGLEVQQSKKKIKSRKTKKASKQIHFQHSKINNFIEDRNLNQDSHKTHQSKQTQMPNLAKN